MAEAKTFEAAYEAVYEFLGKQKSYQPSEEDKENILFEVLLGEPVKESLRKQETQLALSVLRSLDILAAVPETRAYLKTILEKPLKDGE